MWVKSRSASKPALPAMAGAKICGARPPIRIVAPSGSARATWVAATMPPPPPRFSITTLCFNAVDRCSAMMGAQMSAAPPGAKVTTIWIGLLGQMSARAGAYIATSTAHTATRPDAIRFIRSPRPHEPAWWREPSGPVLGGLRIDDQFKRARLLHRQIGRFGSLDDLVHIAGNAASPLGKTRAVRRQRAGLRKGPLIGERRKAIFYRRVHGCLGRQAALDDNCLRLLPGNRGNGAIEFVGSAHQDIVNLEVHRLAASLDLFEERLGERVG